jgi:uncharacterized membrane protein YoaT (DUF817 family)
MNISPTYEDVETARILFRDINSTYWQEHVLFSWQWWLLISATIIPWFVWWKLVNKSMIKEVFIFGLFISAFAEFLDNIGTFYVLWDYPKKLLPAIPPLLPADISFIPVVFMLVYQVCRSWGTYLFTTILISALFSYVLEPIFQIFEMYEYRPPWSHTHSFLGFILYAFLARLFTLKLIRINQSSS